jgi:hypothetical protein
MGKKLGFGSVVNNPDHISESLRKIVFWVKIHKFFDADPGSGIDKIRIQDPGGKHFDPGFRINIPDPILNTGKYSDLF